MRLGVTGATGSFGRALIGRVLDEGRAERIVALSRDELKQAQAAAELGQVPELRWFLGDVRDRARLVEAFQGVDVLVHAAALKRIDAICYNPQEVIKTNVLGTQHVVEAAIEAGVRTVLVLSSDKAVAPCNAYGASKLLAEYYAVQSNAVGYPRGTKVSVVRWGNVFGSRGSVVHVWRAAAAAGKPLRLTDARMTRFVITLDEAVRFTLRWLFKLRGGEVLVPRLPSARMIDLAAAIDPDGEPLEMGFRPGGEKLAEELLSEEEARRTLLVEGAYLVTPSHQTWTAPAWTGVPVGEGFRYRSDLNDRWLSVEALRGLCATV